MKPDKFITTYEVDRRYGGPEEGGWWYNWHQPIETIQIPKVFQRKSKRATKRVEALKQRLQAKFADRAWGNIYHSTGGLLIDTYTEIVRRENQTKHRPYYC
jgi:hypothetical protein